MKEKERKNQVLEKIMVTMREKKRKKNINGECNVMV
jgi:hypothetical protein